ncbi:hypothetical protein QA601_17175 [Chitinispirillales bacterium ANBcel5]|uniref:DUF6588 family protein n=1 Tax=Cellulosispirillum alkaliphilum TaxID=3039283 RepID=UPI002A55C5D3|nr:hypothetical protein [Chitinispirillales bacterium ANBcel5]
MGRFFKALVLLLVALIPVRGNSLNETVNALVDQKDYFRPIATTFGTLTNAGWFQSASVGKEFSFGVSIPISIVYLNGADREYSVRYYDDGCTTCRIQEDRGADVDCRGCIEVQRVSTPTIFGDSEIPELSRSILNRHGSVISVNEGDTGLIGGHLPDVSVLPYVTLQTTFSYYYTALTLRYMGLPEIGISDFGDVKIAFPGFGIHHDFQYLLEDLPFSLSVAANFTWLNAYWKTGEDDDNDIVGEFNLKGLSSFVGIVSGYKPLNFMEVFLEMGWENSFIQPSGTLDVDGTLIDDDDWVRFKGRNGFRASLNVAFPIRFNPVIGMIGGSQFGNFINIISFKSKNSD